MKILLAPGASKNILATIAIGDSYYDAWEKNALPGWRRYCAAHGLGLVAFDEDLIPRTHPAWKKATWQKLLIGATLRREQIAVENVCYLDTDILINHTAPDIFATYDCETIGLVSLRKRLPYPYDEVLRRLAFLRHTFYDASYPLDSALFISLEKLYGHHGLPVQADEACMGLIMFNCRNHADLMRGWFEKYDATVQSVTNGGDQTHVNYEIQNWGKVSWLAYRFQAIWVFEMAWKYPFLYDFGRQNEDLARECIEASLHANHFLHFAGSWHESMMWKFGCFFQGARKSSLLKCYQDYLNMPVTGEPRGLVKPE